MIEAGDRVRVHLNLHRGDFSVADPGSGRVLANVDTITLRSVEFRVQPAMLARIRSMKRRKVCAYAVGYIVDFDGEASGRRVTFNPFRDDTFVAEDDRAPIHQADRVVFHDRHCWISNAS